MRLFEGSPVKSVLGTPLRESVRVNENYTKENEGMVFGEGYEKENPKYDQNVFEKCDNKVFDRSSDRNLDKKPNHKVSQRVLTFDGIPKFTNAELKPFISQEEKHNAFLEAKSLDRRQDKTQDSRTLEIKHNTHLEKPNSSNHHLKSNHTFIPHQANTYSKSTDSLKTNDDGHDTGTKRSYFGLPVAENSPTKRLYLHNMSPNVQRKTIYLPATRTSSSSEAMPAKKRTLEFNRPTLHSRVSNPRSQSTSNVQLHYNAQLRSSKSPVRLLLRRSNSVLTPNEQQSLTSSITDRFIPSRHNSTAGKLQTTIANPHPNASPETHIKAQTSKIYQHHVAEACGLEMNSRVLLYQPLPPERKKPVSLFGSSTTTRNLMTNSKLSPAVALARAKKIPTAPERVLDAPGLVDDFYLNLLAWSLANLLAIGLEDAVYVWNASTGSVGLLCELPRKTLVTSLRWSDDGSYVSIGKDDGMVEIWDIESNTKLRTLNCDNHNTRVASQLWQLHMLTSGSRIGNIYHTDVRVASHTVSKLTGSHLAEVCGIEYRADGQQFATGGNDNLVNIWDVRQSHAMGATPLFSKTNHRAAVKALSWCPQQPSLLATGGGSTDKTINFWNTTTGARVNTIETGSQILSLNWGYALGVGMEIVATHGFPTNNISLFNYPTLQKTGEILGAHDSRILSGCLSPDNLTLATVAGDENLKFWSLFDLLKGARREGDRESSEPSLKDEKSMKKMMNIR